MSDSWKFFVGIDWASAEHEVHVADADGKQQEARPFKHSGDGLAELCERLLSFAPASEIAVAIEVPHGSVVETLLDRGFAVFSINPKQLDRFRDRFTVAGAKDDRRDALVLADSLRTDMQAFRRVEVLSESSLELREWSRMHAELQHERNGLVNQMRAQFMRYFPAFLDACSDPGDDFAIALFTYVGDPQAASGARSSDISEIVKKHRIRRIDAAGLLEILRQRPVVSAPGVAGVAKSHIALLAARVSLINAQMKQCRDQLRQLLDELAKAPEPGQTSEQRDAAIILSVPGVGLIVAATLLGEAAGPLKEKDYSALRALAGVAPVTRRSGKKKVVVMRTACSARLSRAAYHWARVAAMCEPISKKRYADLRARGKPHGQALRCVADRLLGVLCAMLRDQTEFRPSAEAA